MLDDVLWLEYDCEDPLLVLSLDCDIDEELDSDLDNSLLELWLEYDCEDPLLLEFTELTEVLEEFDCEEYEELLLETEVVEFTDELELELLLTEVVEFPDELLTEVVEFTEELEDDNEDETG